MTDIKCKDALLFTYDDTIPFVKGISYEIMVGDLRYRNCMVVLHDKENKILVMSYDLKLSNQNMEYYNVPNEWGD